MRRSPITFTPPDDDRQPEDGELSDSDGFDGSYTPLDRPAERPPVADGDRSMTGCSSDGDSDSDNALIGAAFARKRSCLAAAAAQPTSRPNNIWSVGLQEECLLETLRSCDVDAASTSASDRQCESYDYAFGARLTKRKRDSDADSSDDSDPPAKCPRRLAGRLGRQSVERLAGPLALPDLRPTYASADEMTADLAGKLQERKHELIGRVVRVLGADLARQTFAETQRIEAGGGMLIVNGKRRRTPGGVFLLLLKSDGRLTAGQRAAVFRPPDERSQRDQDVERLKHSLHGDREAAAFGGPDRPANAAAGHSTNPPPSPDEQTDGQRMGADDFEADAMQHAPN